MFVTKSQFRLMDDWRNFACRSHEHNTELLQLAKDINETNKRCIAFTKHLSGELDNARSNVDDLVYKLECLLCHATGNRLSKHTYDLRTMESAVTDYVEKCCDEARAEAKCEVAREIFEDLEMYVEEHDGCSVNLSRCEFAELKKKYTEEKSDE